MKVIKVQGVKLLLAVVSLVLLTSTASWAAPAFKNMFSLPVEPETQIAPGQYFELEVPLGKKVVITDLYVENLGAGSSTFRILQQTGPITFEVRYTYRIAAGEILNINYTTGLRLGDNAPIEGTIRIENASGSVSNIIPRVNGYFVK